jgi:hypothetical protein
MTDARPGGFAALEQALNAYSTAVRRTARSQWFIDSSDDVAAWGTRLAELLQPADRVVIARIPSGASANGWLPKADWEWISEHAS